jgi:hypothetical protein
MNCSGLVLRDGASPPNLNPTTSITDFGQRVFGFREALI